MKYCIGIWALLFLAGCGKGAAPAKPPEAASEGAARPAASSDALPADYMEGGGMDFRLFPSDPTGTGKPSLWLHAGACSRMGNDVWVLEKTHAVIYSHDPKSEDIVVDAAQGEFQQDKMAHLKGGVVANTGQTHIELSDLDWLNDERMAKSDHHVLVVSDVSRLEGSSMRLYPDDNKIVITNATGVLELGKETP